MITRREFLKKAAKAGAGVFVLYLSDIMFPGVTEAHTTRNGRIEIDLSELRLRLYKADELVKTYSVATGKKKNGRSYTRTGDFQIYSIGRNPDWYPPPYVVNKELRKVIKQYGKIPYGHPLNPFRAYFMGFDEGRGIHGTTKPESIGTYASLGCVRMREKDVIELAENHAYIGMPVKVRA